MEGLTIDRRRQQQKLMGENMNQLAYKNKSNIRKATD